LKTGSTEFITFLVPVQFVPGEELILQNGGDSQEGQSEESPIEKAEAEIGRINKLHQSPLQGQFGQ
jgi:hypothetical protein